MLTNYIVTKFSMIFLKIKHMFFIMELIEMLNFLLGLFLGANISLLFYAYIVVGKQSDKYISKEVKSE